jgi:uncharacterized membrane protein YfcA
MIRTILGAAIGMLSGLINGVLGAGGGTIIVPALERFLKVPAHKAHATAISIILPLTIVSGVFLFPPRTDKHASDFNNFFIGNCGRFCRCQILKEIVGKTIRIVFAVSMIVAGLRMLWK